MAYKLLLVYKDDLVTEVVDRWDIPKLILNKKGDEVKRVKFLPTLKEIKKALQKHYKEMHKE